ERIFDRRLDRLGLTLEHAVHDGSIVLLQGLSRRRGHLADANRRDTTMTMQNPLFAAYAIAAAIMIIKTASMSWLTVARMMKVNAGFRAPEDVKKTPLNPNPDPKQLEPNEHVERIRRIHMNDLENVPFFLFAGLLFVLTDPPLLLARVL